MHKHWPKDDPGYDRAPWCKLLRKECDELYAEWQADQQVALAVGVVAGGRAPRYKKDTTVFGQLVQMLAGERQTITNADGVESGTPFTQRVLRALNRTQLVAEG